MLPPRAILLLQVLYTNPVTPRAGEDVTVFYNPDITVLRGRPEIYLRGCWNRCCTGLVTRPTPSSAEHTWLHLQHVSASVHFPSMSMTQRQHVEEVAGLMGRLRCAGGRTRSASCPCAWCPPTPAASAS